MKEYVFESTIYSSEIGKGGAYVIFPYDLRAEWNKGRLKRQHLMALTIKEVSSIWS